MSGIRKKFSFQLLFAFSQLVFPLITYPYITRTIGAAGLGLVGYVEYVSGFIIAIASFGIPFYGIREAAKLQGQPTAQQKLFTELFSIHLFSSTLGCVVFLAIVNLNPHQNLPSTLIALGCLNILLPAFIAEWFLQGNEAFAFITTRSIVLRFLGVAATFLFVSGFKDAAVYYLIIIAVQTAVAMTNLLKIGAINYRITIRNSIRHLKGLWHFFISSSVISVYVFFDIIILGWMTDNVQVGYYTVAIKIIKLSLLAVLSLNVILFPRISFLKQQNPDVVGALIHKSMQYILLLTIPMFVGFLTLANPIVNLLAGHSFVPAGILIRILSAIPLVIGFNNLFVYQILTPFGGEKKLLWSVLIACVCSLLLHATLVYYFKATGTAIATLLTEFLVMVLTGYFAHQHFRFRFPLEIMWQSLLASLPIFLLATLSSSLSDNPLTVLLLAGLGGGGVYILLQRLVFKNELLTQMLLVPFLKKRIYK